MLTELGQVSDARVIDAKISELQEELNTVWDTLMGYELQLAEQLEVGLDIVGLGVGKPHVIWCIARAHSHNMIDVS